MSITSSISSLHLVGACYIDTILKTPHYPHEDEKLRATSTTTRRGGNCGNSLEVAQSFLPYTHQGDTLRLSFYTVLPDMGSADVRFVRRSLENEINPVDIEGSFFREGRSDAMRAYVISTGGSRTVVTVNKLEDMQVGEILDRVGKVAGESTWWHFEGRLPEVTIEAVRDVKRRRGIVSVEVERPGRPGLREVAGEADVVFISKSWAEHEGYQDAWSCLEGEVKIGQIGYCTWGAEGAAGYHRIGDDTNRIAHSPAQRIDPVDTIGAGDTFIGIMLCQLAMSDYVRKWHREALGADTFAEMLAVGVDGATGKVLREGFEGMERVWEELGRRGPVLRGVSESERSL